MHLTIFDTPVVNVLMRWFSCGMLRLLGWKLEGQCPAEPKYVLIAAPHTSNWDFPFTLMVCFGLRLRIHWIGKSSLFPLGGGWLARWLGGIPVDRSRSGNMVQSTVDAFAANPRLALVLSPEGTRGKVSHWKTGFYHIACGAGVPVAMAFLDYRRKVGGIGRMLTPSGDLERDMEEIQAFYRNVSGKNPHMFDADQIRVKD